MKAIEHDFLAISELPEIAYKSGASSAKLTEFG
jgi:hypothetical protein